MLILHRLLWRPVIQKLMVIFQRLGGGQRYQPLDKGSPITGGNKTIINAGVPPACFGAGHKGIDVDFPLVLFVPVKRRINANVPPASFCAGDTRIDVDFSAACFDADETAN